jgi:hypothetical protein
LLNFDPILLHYKKLFLNRGQTPVKKLLLVEREKAGSAQPYTQKPGKIRPGEITNSRNVA